MSMKEVGQNLIRKSLFWSILKRAGILFLMQRKIMLIIFNNFLLNMNGLLDKHAPFRKVSKYQPKLKTKPWITAAIHKSILVKNSLFKKYIKLKDPVK